MTHTLKRALVMLSVLAGAGCDSGCDEEDFTPTGPSNLALVRIVGPSQVQVGQAVQYRAYARPMGGDETDVTDAAKWSASPAGRLNIAAGGRATGVTEGQTTVSVELNVNGVTSGMPVNVVGVPAPETAEVPPTAPTPPPTGPAPPATPTGEVSVQCPTTLKLDQTAICAATHTADRVDRDVTHLATWSSSEALFVSVNANVIRGENLGTAFVTATYQTLTGRAQVTVVPPADGQYDAVFVPRSNTCSFSVRPVRTGVMTITFRNGTLAIGGANQAYTFTYGRQDNRVNISGRSTANGFAYAMELTESGSTTFTGSENIAAPEGCGAIYDVTLTRR